MARTPAVRDRILGAGARLFGEFGIRGVGVDAIIASAEVAKASFYHHFPSKDALVVAWLESREARWLDPMREEVERRTEAPWERLPMFLQLLGELVSEPMYPGCPYINTAAEFHDASPPVRALLIGFNLDVCAYLESLVADADAADPDGLVAELRVMVAGALAVTTLMQDRGDVARAALDAVQMRLGAPSET